MVHAQWQDTTYTLKGGWNAIYLSGDADYASLETLFPNSGATASIQEVWRWNPKETEVQFTQSPLIPSAGTPEWTVWVRGGGDTLRLTGQDAYLVKCAGTATDTYSVTLRQSPLPPRNTWVRNGANLLGFPTFKNGSNYPTFSNYFATFPAAIAVNTKIYKYVGGELGPNNPLQVFSPISERLDRTQAYWFSAEVVGDFYAPIEISLSSNDGLAFGRTGSGITARIRNRTSGVVTLTLTPTNSLDAPAGQPFITAPVPLTLRTYDTETLLWTEAPITAVNNTKVIGPQSTVELNFGINRADPAMSGAGAGAKFASLLSLKDSGNLMDVFLPVKAEKATLAGLWVGDISLNQVGSRVTNTARATATVTNGVVTAVTVSGTGGYGYGAAPAVTIAPPPAVQATGTAAVTGDAVVSITLTNPGAGYDTAPTITIAPPPTGGTTATATAALNAGSLSTVITITNGGSGYTGNPSVTFSAPPNAGTTATATANVAAGAVTGFTIIHPGSRYAIASPEVMIDPPPALEGTSTPRPMHLRTLLHVADNGTASLLSQVFLGELQLDDPPPAPAYAFGLCTQETRLKQDAKASAQRLVATHLPLKQDFSGSGSVAFGSVLTRIIQIPYNDPTNPFVHQYHPDHDNKDARFRGVGNGVESYSVTRTCEFTFTSAPPPGTTGASGWGSSVIGGTYHETITGIHKQEIQLNGTFILRRASELGTLHTN